MSGSIHVDPITVEKAKETDASQSGVTVPSRHKVSHSKFMRPNSNTLTPIRLETNAGRNNRPSKLSSPFKPPTRPALSPQQT